MNRPKRAPRGPSFRIKTENSRSVGRSALAGVLLFLIVVLVGCVTPPLSMDAPDGFAAFSESEVVRAISPEGVVIRARSLPNEPEQSLDFWAEALERHLTDSGYLLVERAPFDAATGAGVLLEWLAPVNQEDWIYLTAVTVAGSRIAVIESAGPAELYETYRDAIRTSLATVSLDGGSPAEE